MNRLTLLALCAFTLCLAACQPHPPAVVTPPYAVAMPDRFSATAAMDVMAEGGNAVDAAIAAQFVLAVTLPEAGNLGGGGFMTLWYEGNADFLDYRETAPAAAHRDMYLDENGTVKQNELLWGAKAAGVPGTVAGMWQAHQRYGKLPWSRLVAPALDYAENGFEVPPQLADNIAEQIARLEELGIATNFAQYFAAATAGSLFKQPELAATLKRIQHQGPDGFYAGETAALIADFAAREGGLITKEDLAEYKAVWRAPIEYDWRGYQLITAPPPSSGGVAAIQWLSMLDKRVGDNPLPLHNSVDYVHIMSEIGKRVFADRAEYMGDPDFVEVPVTALLNDNYLDSRAREIQIGSISPTDAIRPGLYESEDTTHFSVLDQWGNAVANTTTINLSFGSSVVVEGAGFLLNDEMDDFSAKPGVPNFFGAVGGSANEIAPRKRMLSSMTPTIVVKAGEVQLVTGSPGGTTIISSVVQSIANALLFDMPAEQVVNTPRFHHQLLPKDTLYQHDGFEAWVTEGLAAMGYVLKPSNFGDLQVIKRTPEGLEAASEARGRGQSIVSTQ